LHADQRSAGEPATTARNAGAHRFGETLAPAAGALARAADELVLAFVERVAESPALARRLAIALGPYLSAIPADGVDPRGAPALLPTPLAARYCGFKSGAALRKAAREGRVQPIGRRGGFGPLMWRTTDLDGFLAGRRAPIGRRSGDACKETRSDGDGTVDVALEVLGGTDAPTRRVEEEGRRLPRAGAGDRSNDGAP
jgi:hypothetical protein